jgi:uncharacterized protein
MIIKNLKALLFLSVMTTSLAQATADGPDFFQSRPGVSKIHIFEKPEPTSKELKSFNAPLTGLRNLGCQDSPSFSEFNQLSEQQRLTFSEKIWCKIAYHEIEGWVQSKYLAEDPQSKLAHYDCKNRNGEVENIICNNQELIKLDYQLQAIYDQALAKAASIDDRPKEAVKLLKTTQRGWIKGRNDCWKESDAKIKCIKSNYEQRIAFLQAKWILVPQGATNQYFCQENKSGFTITFYPTQPIASIAVEYGDQRLIFLQIDTKNRNRYDGEFGRYIELGNKDGLFVWEQTNPPLKCILQK